MGIRFACHSCGKHLNIKNELAGRRGICPSCSGRFRIPLEDAEQSTPVDEPKSSAVESAPAAANLAASMPAEPSQQPADQAAAAALSATLSAAPAQSATPAPEYSSLDILTSDPTSTWYVRPPNGGQYGPATGEILRQWIAEGRVATTALLWRDGWPQWREASEALPELAARLPNPNGGTPQENVAGPNGNPSQGHGVAAASNAVSKNQPAATTTAKPSPQPIAQPSSTTTRGLRKNTQRGESAAGENSAAAAAKERAKIAGDEFGYEDSVFARNENSYTTNETAQPKFTGRDDVGKIRRARATRRTMSIVVLGIFSMVLIGALIFVTTR